MVTRCKKLYAKNIITQNVLYRAYSLLQASNQYHCHVLLGSILFLSFGIQF